MNISVRKVAISATIAAAIAIGGVTAASANVTPATDGAPGGQLQFAWTCVNVHTNQIVGDKLYAYPTTDGRARPSCTGSNYRLIKIDEGKTGPAGPQGPAGKDGSVYVGSATSLSGGQVVLTHIGGRIADGITPLTEDLVLPAGTYQLTAYGDFSRQAGTGGDNPTGNSTYGSLSIWVDTNNDGHYDWQTGENGGTVQTGALPITPTGSIEQSATEQQILTVPAGATYHVRLGGFGYNSNTSGYGTAGQPGAGDFSVLGAKLDAVQLVTR